MITEPMQRLLDLLAEAELTKPKPVDIPQKCLDEMNLFGEIRSREEFLELMRGRV